MGDSNAAAVQGVSIVMQKTLDGTSSENNSIRLSF